MTAPAEQLSNAGHNTVMGKSSSAIPKKTEDGREVTETKRAHEGKIDSFCKRSIKFHFLPELFTISQLCVDPHKYLTPNI